MNRRLAAFVVPVLAVAVAGCGSSSPSAPSQPPVQAPAPPAPPPGASPALSAMIRGLPAYISDALAREQESLPRNPGMATFIQAKIDMLRNPALATQIVGGQLWLESSASSIGGRGVQIVVLFPQPSMREDAARAVAELTRGLPILETFMATPFPHEGIRMWYGFTTGNSGGGGTLHMEDRVSYETRTGPGRPLPYDAILHHELSHSYIGNEALTQFLELYIYNRLRTGSQRVDAWVHTRDYAPFAPSNENSAAILDVYQLIGHDPMADAYCALHPLRPPYGQPLSQPARQAFIDRAPEPARDQVAALVARVTF